MPAVNPGPVVVQTTNTQSTQAVPSLAQALQSTYVIAQTGLPVILPGSMFFANNGVMVIGQAPSAAATATFSATSGAGVTMTMSAATLLGTAADVGRVLTILDQGIYKYATITAQSSTTVATVTLTGVALSGVGPFANNTIWLTGTIPGTGNTVAFSPPTRVIYANCYFYLPASAIFSGSTAGVYFAQGSNTTVYVVYDNILLSGVPTIPAVPTPFVCTGAGAVAQTTGSNVTVMTIPIPANAMGPSGRVRVTSLFSNNNSGNTKVGQYNFGSTGIAAASNTANQTQPVLHDITNRGVTNAQVTYGSTGFAATAAAPLEPIGGNDTTQIVNILCFLQLVTTATDFCQWDQMLVEITPGS